jgi:GT2 family glycosyltransferase
MIIYTIVVTHNGGAWISKCLNSIEASDTPVNVIVIDNNSEDDTVNIIERDFIKIQLIRSPVNLGFGKANNIGIKIAIENNADYIFLLNQDAWVESNTIKDLVNISSLHPEYGILSPFHISGNQKTIDSLFSTYITQEGCNNLMSDIFFNKGRLLDVYETNFVNAAFWLITRNCINSIGGFDPIFHVYGEDDDYINRVKFHNFKIGICPNLIGYHDRPQKSHKNINYNRIFAKELLYAKTYLPSKNYYRIKYLGYMIFNIFSSHESKKNNFKIIGNILKEYKTIKQNHYISRIKGINFL